MKNAARCDKYVNEVVSEKDSAGNHRMILYSNGQVCQTMVHYGGICNVHVELQSETGSRGFHWSLHPAGNVPIALILVILLAKVGLQKTARCA